MTGWAEFSRGSCLLFLDLDAQDVHQSANFVTYITKLSLATQALPSPEGAFENAMTKGCECVENSQSASSMKSNRQRRIPLLLKRREPQFAGTTAGKPPLLSRTFRPERRLGFVEAS